MSQFFASGGQSIGVSASASVLPMNSQEWFPLGWTGWISLQSKGLSRVFSNTQFKSINPRCSSFFTVQLSHPYKTTGKIIALTRWTFVGKIMFLLFNMLTVHGVAKSWIQLSDFTFTFLHLRRKWQPTPVFLPGESQRQTSLVGCRLWGRTESDTTEAT